MTTAQPHYSERTTHSRRLKLDSSCRFCGSQLARSVVDLGMSPLANSYVAPDQLHGMEAFYPLRVYVCDRCMLVQLMEYETSETIFSHYAYFSSYSQSWLAHARAYTERMVERFGLNAKSRVVEIASNDGYLLQYMKQAGVGVLGIEPAKNVADVAIAKGIPTLCRFFGQQLARELAADGKQADVLLGNNVLAHVPNLNDFVAGMKLLLAPRGVITMEFPHLVRLVAERQFDTIYHEHFSYFSFTTVERVFAHHGITLFDVEEIPTHGGSLRIYGRQADDASKPIMPSVGNLRAREEVEGFNDFALYENFADQVKDVKREVLAFLIDAKRGGKSIAAYGAPAKGNTLLNYCGIRTDMIDYTVDASPHKQGHYLPGTRIPIYAPEYIRQTRPDYLVILPWNLKTEIIQQTGFIREWGGRCVTFIPTVTVHE